MKARGSITIFFVLILSVLFSMMGSLLLSAKVIAGRAVIAAAVDGTMYSAMAKYDRQLFEEYHLLYIDGGYGSGNLQLGKTLAEMRQDMSYMLTPNKDREMAKGTNFLQLEEISGGISGYTLATDCQGDVFWEQVVSYMEDTLGLQGISLLTKKITEENNILVSQEKQKEEIEENGSIDDYVKLKNECEEREIQGEKENELQEEKKEETGQENTEGETVDEETRKKGEEARNTMDVITSVKREGLLSLVIPEEQELSDWSADRHTLLRNRNIQEGMGYLELTKEQQTFTDDLLFQEYMMKNLNYYGSHVHTTGPAYGVEWVLFGENVDVKNLEKAVNRIFLAREAVNSVSLYNDKSRYEQVEIMATGLAAVLQLPGVESVLKAALTLAWAYVESVVDVSAMLRGEKVPLVKQVEDWQVEFTEILSALDSPESFYLEGKGMNYEDYLRLLLLTKNRQDQIYGCMEVIELSMREIDGKDNFSMDCAIDSIEAEFQICAQNFKTYTVMEKRSYRSM